MAKIIPIDGDKIRLPGPRDRIAIIGPTGSGKTVAGIWHLSLVNFDVRPWIIVDPKIDDNIAMFNAEEISIYDEELPHAPGLYKVHPLPSQLDDLDAMMLRIWERENIGVYCDEGYMNADGDGFLACVTQGRSKHIPMIILAQRPVFVSRFVFSESNFYQVFGLNDERDRRTLRSFCPVPDGVLPEYHSWYYDVSRKRVYHFRPVPNMPTVAATIQNRLDALHENDEKMYASARRI